MKDELVTISVEGARLDALAADVGEIRRARIGESVQLLPLFDPYLLGHATRDHLFARVHASKVSRTAGWISAVVLVEGSVAGTWTHTVTSKILRVAVTPFSPLQPRVKSAIRERAAEMSRALGATRAEVTVD